MRLAPSAIPLATVLLTAQVQPQSVARINVTPAAPSVLATQTLQLRAEAVDSAGKPVPGATIRFQGGSIFEGGVDQQGLVSGGAPGVLDVTVTALVPGQRPVVQRVKINVLPGLAARIVRDPRPTRLVVGQEIKLKPSVYSKANEPRSKDVVTWSTSAPRVASVNRDGMIAGVKAGRATITAAAGDAKETLAVEVIASDIRSVTISPATTEARTGDVIHFTASVKDAAGREITGLTPTWLMNGGEGLIGSIEGKGADPGTVDAIDLVALEKVASIDVAQQAGGIDFWRSEAGAR